MSYVLYNLRAERDWENKLSVAAALPVSTVSAQAPLCRLQSPQALHGAAIVTLHFYVNQLLHFPLSIPCKVWSAWPGDLPRLSITARGGVWKEG